MLVKIYNYYISLFFHFSYLLVMFGSVPLIQSVCCSLATLLIQFVNESFTTCNQYFLVIR